MMVMLSILYLHRNLDPGNVIWRHYQTWLMPELVVKSGILKEMLMLRDSNEEQILNKQFICLD